MFSGRAGGIIFIEPGFWRRPFLCAVRSNAAEAIRFYMRSHDDVDGAARGTGDGLGVKVYRFMQRR